MWSHFEKLADAIINDINGGLRGYHTNMSLSKELLILDIIDERLLIIKEYSLKGLLPVLDLMVSLNCIPVDCDSLSKCGCNTSICGKPLAHFEIPQILLDWGLTKAIQYIGSTDRQHPFLIYTQSLDKAYLYLKYRKRGKGKPWVYVNTTPNSNGLLDCYIFGAPLIKLISITAIFKDLSQLKLFDCCGTDDNFTFLNALIKERLTRKKLLYYRSFAPQNLPNDLQYTAG